MSSAARAHRAAAQDTLLGAVDMRMSHTAVAACQGISELVKHKPKYTFRNARLAAAAESRPAAHSRLTTQPALAPGPQRALLLQAPPPGPAQWPAPAQARGAVAAALLLLSLEALLVSLLVSLAHSREAAADYH